MFLNSQIFSITSRLRWRSYHNDMIQGLNSIYLQAPHVQTKDQRSFCSYIIRWHQLLHVHHSAEEAEFFPDVEAMAGERGIMEANVDQHHAFTDSA